MIKKIYTLYTKYVQNVPKKILCTKVEKIFQMNSEVMYNVQNGRSVIRVSQSVRIRLYNKIVSLFN